MFQSKNVVGELIERLSDSVDEVVVEASGALRNLAIDGGFELCGEMFNKGVMSHLAVLMGKVGHAKTTLIRFPTRSLLFSAPTPRRSRITATPIFRRANTCYRYLKTSYP
jgi:hypothetical protein